MPLFHWSEKYQLKIYSIDNQHLQLFQIMNYLHESIASEKGMSEINQLVTELLKYTINHLQFEEGLLAEYAYPELINHKNEHASFTEKIVKYDIELKMNGKIDAVELLAFMIDWLQNHILETDFKYKDFLIAQGAK